MSTNTDISLEDLPENENDINLTVNNKLLDDNFSNVDVRKSHIRPTTVKLDSSKSQNSYGSLLGSLFWNKAITYPENVYCVKVTDDELYWVVGLHSGIISFYPTEKSKDSPYINNLKISSENYPVTDFQFISFDKKHEVSKLFVLACYASGFIRLWHYNSPNIRNRLIREWREIFYETEIKEVTVERNNQLLALSVSPDYQRFISGGDDHVIKVYEITGRDVLRNLYEPERMMIQTGHISPVSMKLNHHTMRITALKYHPLGKTNSSYQHIFVSASWDNTIHIWDDRKEASLWVYDGPHVCGSDGIDIDPIENTILSCSWRRDKSIFQIWKFNDYIIGSSNIDGRSMTTEFNSPVTEFHQDISQIPSQGYLARYVCEAHFVMFGGSNHNIFKLVETSNMASTGVLCNLKNGVLGADYYMEGRKIKFGIVTGCNLLLVTLDNQRKTSNNTSILTKNSSNARG